VLRYRTGAGFSRTAETLDHETLTALSSIRHGHEEAPQEVTRDVSALSGRGPHHGEVGVQGAGAVAMTGGAGSAPTESDQSVFLFRAELIGTL